jgi:hypothetical protein
MKFVKLTDRHNSDNPIYINAEQIVALRRISDSTWVHTGAHAKSDAAGVFVVSEMPEVILALAGN